MRALPRLVARRWRAATVLLLAAITILSLLPRSAAEIPLASHDKLQHLLAYAALVLPAALARPRGWLALVAALALWSGAIELIQPHVGRTAHLADLGANLAGLALGIAAAALLRRFALP